MAGADAVITESSTGREGVRTKHPSSHHFTVDVEEYFQVSALEVVTSRSAWDSYESRVESSIAILLDVLAAYGARGTFFVLGWLAERRPSLVRRIAAQNHEIASHGMDHRRITECTPSEFRESVQTSKRLLEDLSGVAVTGFRAPSFSLVPGLEWALDVLLEEGYCYDSSLFPVRRRGYGYPNAQRDPHWIERPNGMRIGEFPPATLRQLGVNLPAGGGAYFRLFPPAMIEAAFAACEQRGVAGTFYIHPWELDPAQPRFRVPFTTRTRHYGGLHGTLPRLKNLLSRFRFTDTMAESLARMTVVEESKLVSSPDFR